MDDRSSHQDDRGRGRRTLLTLAFVAFVGYLLLLPFRRRIGGAGGGSEKAIVGALFVIAAIVLGIYLADR